MKKILKWLNLFFKTFSAKTLEDLDAIAKDLDNQLSSGEIDQASYNTAKRFINLKKIELSKNINATIDLNTQEITNTNETEKPSSNQYYERKEESHEYHDYTSGHNVDTYADRTEGEKICKFCGCRQSSKNRKCELCGHKLK